MRVFCKAQKFAGVNVDEKTVCRSVAWLINNQRADGALHEVNHVIHREMVVRAFFPIYLKIYENLICSFYY